jgi:phospholipid transport system substrate-binding protein
MDLKKKFNLIIKNKQKDFKNLKNKFNFIIKNKLRVLNFINVKNKFDFIIKNKQKAVLFAGAFFVFISFVFFFSKDSNESDVVENNISDSVKTANIPKDNLLPLELNESPTIKDELISPKKPDKSKIEKEKAKKIPEKPIKKVEKIKTNPGNSISTVLELHDGLSKISSEQTNIFPEIKNLIRVTYDTEKMVEMIVGRVWEKADSKQKNEILSEFEEYIAKNYIRRFKNIDKLKFTNLESRKFNNAYNMVKTELILNNNEKVGINYLLIFNNNKWKVFDILLSGSVSEIATKKSEFSSFIRNGDMSPLIAALKKKNAELLN